MLRFARRSPIRTTVVTFHIGWLVPEAGLVDMCIGRVPMIDIDHDALVDVCAAGSPLSATSRSGVTGCDAAGSGPDDATLLPRGV